MTSATTLANARIHIAQVLQADSKDKLRMLDTYARAWIACLRAEGLISEEHFILLGAELNDAVRDALANLTHLEQQAQMDNKPSHDDSDYAP